MSNPINNTDKRKPVGLWFAEEPSFKHEETEWQMKYDEDLGLTIVEHNGKRIPLVEIAQRSTQTQTVTEAQEDPDEDRDFDELLRSLGVYLATQTSTKMREDPDTDEDKDVWR